MVHDDDWYDDPLDDEVDSITNTAYDVPLYDEDGNERNNIQPKKDERKTGDRSEYTAEG